MPAVSGKLLAGQIRENILQLAIYHARHLYTGIFHKIPEEWIFG